MKHWFILTIVAAAILYLLALDPVLDLNGDSPRFVMLARSIHDGQGYYEHFDIEDWPETQIPYLYPLMLTPLVAVAGPDSYLVFKTLSVGCTLLALCSMWFWMSEWIGENEARWIVIVAALLTQTQLLAGRIATEAPFLAASFTCLALMERILRSSSFRVRDWILCILCIGISFHLRAAGWSLLATFCLILLWRRGWRPALAGALFGLAACSPWLIRIIRFGFGYSAEFEQNTTGPFALISRFAYNTAADVAKSLLDLFAYPFFSAFLPYEPLFFLKAAIGAGIAVLMIRGFWKYARDLRRKEILPTELYFVIYLAGALSWTVHGERYLLPVLPVLIAALLWGAGRWRTHAATALLCVGLAGCTWTIYKARAGIRPREEQSFMDAVQWVKDNVPKTEHVMSRYPTWVGTVTGHRGKRWGEVDNPAVHRKVLLDNNISWVITDHIKVFRQTGTDRLMPLIGTDAGEFTLRFQSKASPTVNVYQFTPSH